MLVGVSRGDTGVTMVAFQGANPANAQSGDAGSPRPSAGPTASPSGGRFVERPAQRPAPQQPEAVEVEVQHRERHDAGEAVLAVGPHPVETAVLQILGRRVDCRMLPARRDEGRTFRDSLDRSSASNSYCHESGKAAPSLLPCSQWRRYADANLIKAFCSANF